MTAPIRAVGAAILQDGTCLVTQRGSAMSYANKWEFPGGKVEPGETPRDALRREIREELSIDIQVGEFLGSGHGSSGPEGVVIDVYAARQVGGRLRLDEHSRLGWFQPEDFSRLDWVDPALEVIEAVRVHLRQHGSNPIRSFRPGQHTPFAVPSIAMTMTWAAWPTSWMLYATGLWTTMFSSEVAFQNGLWRVIASLAFWYATPLNPR